MARIRLFELIDTAERGVTTEITRNGKVIACLVPAGEARVKRRNAAVMDRIAALSNTLEIKGRVDLKNAIEAGC